MRTERQIAASGFELWQSLYARGVATGRGELVAPEEERVAATDELLAASIPGLMRVSSVIAASAVVRDQRDLGATAPKRTAAVLRLLDSALAAHGRDHGYDVDAWRARAVMAAWVTGDELADGDSSLQDVLELAVQRVAGALAALARDRLGVPENLAEASGQMLVIFAVASERRR